MHALLLIAHGSRRQASNDEILELTERVRAVADGRFDRVETAFLELASPSVEDALQACVRQGATRITVAPYFLAGGTHVSKDVPAAVTAFGAQHPEIRIGIAPHIGKAAQMAELVVASAAG